MMRVLLSFLLLVMAAGVLAYEHYNIEYWRTQPEIRAQKKWAIEIQNVQRKSKKIAMALELLKSIEMTTTDQQFKDLIDKSKVPFRKSSKGTYDLKIQIMPWIEDMKYGYLIQHELFEANGNKINEFNVNVDIGFLW